jgi:hypothetical protein
MLRALSLALIVAVWATLQSLLVSVIDRPCLCLKASNRPHVQLSFLSQVTHT